MTSNGTLKDGCDERHDVRFRKRWRCLLGVKDGHADLVTGESGVTPAPDVPGSGPPLRLRAYNGLLRCTPDRRTVEPAGATSVGGFCRPIELRQPTDAPEWGAAAIVRCRWHFCAKLGVSGRIPMGHRSPGRMPLVQTTGYDFFLIEHLCGVPRCDLRFNLWSVRPSVQAIFSVGAKDSFGRISAIHPTH